MHVYILHIFIYMLFTHLVKSNIVTFLIGFAFIVYFIIAHIKI